jgi:hypothetical protein
LGEKIEATLGSDPRHYADGKREHAECPHLATGGLLHLRLSYPFRLRISLKIQYNTTILFKLLLNYVDIYYILFLRCFYKYIKLFATRYIGKAIFHDISAQNRYVIPLLRENSNLGMINSYPWKEVS